MIIYVRNLSQKYPAILTISRICCLDINLERFLIINGVYQNNLRWGDYVMGSVSQVQTLEETVIVSLS